jgi:hypothetical protein
MRLFEFYALFGGPALVILMAAGLLFWTTRQAR